jgi:transcription antitermination factor NusB
MRKRTKAREFALQALYQMDLTQDKPDVAIDNFWVSQGSGELDAEVKLFSDNIVKGVARHLQAIDERISKYATNWQLERMAVVDRNILRMATFELLYCEDIPPKVSINEAVNLAKKFSGLEAGKFVNGILDKIKIEAGSA